MSKEPESTVPQVSEHKLLTESREDVDAALIRAVRDPLRWGEMLFIALVRLCEAFERHIEAAEGTGGTLGVVIQRRPELDHAVRIQQQEHIQVLSELTTMRDRLGDGIKRGEIDSDMLRWRVAPIQDSVRRHMARANDLLFHAFNTEDGGQG